MSKDVKSDEDGVIGLDPLIFQTRTAEIPIGNNFIYVPVDIGYCIKSRCYGYNVRGHICIDGKRKRITCYNECNFCPKCETPEEAYKTAIKKINEKIQQRDKQKIILLDKNG